MQLIENKKIALAAEYPLGATVKVYRLTDGVITVSLVR
jgi:hypothetical protein